MSRRTDPLHSALARAEHLVDLARYDEAEQILDDAIASEPHDGALFCVLSRCYYGADRYGEAVQAADRALALDPEDAWAHRLRALALVQLKQGKAAVASARAAVRIEPGEFAYIVLTRALIVTKDWKGAYAAAYQARDLDPQSSTVHANLGYLSLARKKWSDAEAHLRRALELDPNDAEAINNLGVALGARGRSGEALEAFARSSRTDPRLTEGRENAAVTARRFGGIGLVLAIWFVVRVLSVGGRQAVREDGQGLDPSIIGAVLLFALAVAGLVVVRTIRRAKGLEPGLARYVKEQQLSRIGVGPRAREYRWGLLFGLLLAFGLGVFSGVLAFAPDVAAWRVLGWIGLAVAGAQLFFVTRSWWPRRAGAKRLR